MPDIYKTEEVDFVYVNQFKGGYLASEHLLNLGHKNILCISANVGGDEFRLRTEGFKSAFTDHGLEFDDKMLFFLEIQLLSRVIRLLRKTKEY